MNTENNTRTLGADLARIDSELDALRFHALHLKGLSDFIIAADPVYEPRVDAAYLLAEHVLGAIEALPALFACEEVAL